MSLHVHRSNALERLADRLGDVVRDPVGDAAVPECIVVQGRGMERWLSMRLAERFGVWANPDFPFPRKILLRAIEAAGIGGRDGADPFDPRTLTWAIFDGLPGLLALPGFEPIAGYLKDDPLGLRRIGLASRLAETFDQYVVFRPRMVAEWERRGDPGDWQAMLWSALVGRYGRSHLGAKLEALLAAGAGPTPLDGFPARLGLFGVSALPPLYLEAFLALARRIEVHLFVLAPSPHYWAHIRSQREILRELVESGGDLDEEALHLESGNPLLASLGRVGRDFQAILEGTGEYEESGPDLYVDPGEATMLATVQSDVLELRHRRPGNPPAEPIVLDDADGSIAVHACHGPMREVEVLHDQLLDLFEKNPALEPRDVVVLSPAIDEYAPYVEAVFGRPPMPGRPQIPHHVADRAVRETDEVVDAFARILDVLLGRLGAAEVLDLLALEPVRERFDIAGEDVDVLREWVSEAGIRWGADAEHRRAERSAPAHENTWRFGLDRLLVGHAIGREERRLFAGVLPFPGVEGREDLLGRFVDFCDSLFGFRAALASPLAVAGWAEKLGALLARMVAVTRLNRDQHRRLRKALGDLAERASLAGAKSLVSLQVLRCELDAELERAPAAGAFLSRGVTFCALVPMRSIPFRVVCLLGMNDGAFPRVRRPLGFDRMIERRRAGDRSVRDDDRYLFLEALLSARERLLVTYVGRGIHDNAVYPPSVVVSELLDVLDESFRLPTGRPVYERIVVEHPLQAFSRRYFAADGDPRLFRYDVADREGAERLGEERRGARPFLSRPLRPPADRVATIEDLARFFENPARAFARRRLGLAIDDEARDVDFQDPVAPGGLDRWKIGREWIEAELGNEDPRDVAAAIRAAGSLPHGSAGDVVLEDIRETARAIVAKLEPIRGCERLEPVVVDRTVAGTRLGGTLRDLWPAAQVLYSASKIAARREIGTWVRHLVLCSETRPGLPRETRLVGRKGDRACSVVFRSVDQDRAETILAGLLDLYWIGQTAPLPFFPETARCFVSALRSGDAGRALERGRGLFRGGPYTEGAEGNDVYVKLAFGGGDPLDDGFRVAAEGAEAMPSFSRLARIIFADLDEHRSEE